VTDELYSGAGDARARFDSIASRSDSMPVAGIADGAYVQQPPVSAGLLHGNDFVAVEGVPRESDDTATTAAYQSLLRTIAAHFDHPAAGGTPRALVKGDYDPCAVAHKQPLKRRVTSVVRVPSELPPAAACRIALKGPVTVTVYTLTDKAANALAPGTSLTSLFDGLRKQFGPNAASLAGYPDSISEPGQVALLDRAETDSQWYESRFNSILWWIHFRSGVGLFSEDSPDPKVKEIQKAITPLIERLGRGAAPAK